MNATYKVLLVALALAMPVYGLAQTSGTTGSTTSADTASADKAKAKAAKKKKFAAEQKQMEAESRSSASGAMSSGGAAQPTTKMSGKGTGKEMQQSMQNESRNMATGSPPVNKNAKAQDPMKDISKMTPEERAQLRKQTVEGAKP